MCWKEQRYTNAYGYTKRRQMLSVRVHAKIIRPLGLWVVPNHRTAHSTNSEFVLFCWNVSIVRRAYLCCRVCCCVRVRITVNTLASRTAASVVAASCSLLVCSSTLLVRTDRMKGRKGSRKGSKRKAPGSDAVAEVFNSIRCFLFDVHTRVCAERAAGPTRRRRARR